MFANIHPTSSVKSLQSITSDCNSEQTSQLLDSYRTQQRFLVNNFIQPFQSDDSPSLYSIHFHHTRYLTFFFLRTFDELILWVYTKAQLKKSFPLWSFPSSRLAVPIYSPKHLKLWSIVGFNYIKPLICLVLLCSLWVPLNHGNLLCVFALTCMQYLGPSNRWSRN